MNPTPILSPINPHKEKNMLTQESIAHFYGSETFTRFSALFRRHILTEGALHVAEKGHAYWLMDAIASHYPKTRQHPFQVWKLTKNKTTDGAYLEAEDGDGNKIASQRIPYTNFPLPEITLWAVESGENVVIMLPSEY